MPEDKDPDISQNSIEIKKAEEPEISKNPIEIKKDKLE